MIEWIYLFTAGFLEIAWAIGLKYSNGMTRLIPSLITIFLGLLSFGFLSQALKTIPVGTAYSVYTGIGAVGTVIAGIIFFNEPKEFFRFLFVFLIIIGIVGLKFVSKG
jgi:quaternary ammonium compound-resistance protein SugE